MTRTTFRTLLAALAVAAVFALPAQGAAQLAITSPISGSTISRAAEPTINATGTATLADPVASTRTFYLRRDACGGTAPANLRMTLRTGTDAGDNCGSTYAGLPTEVFATAGLSTGTTAYPATEGLPMVLDVAKKVTGTMKFSADGPVGIARVEIWLASDQGEVGRTTVEKTLQGDLTYEVPFTFDVAPALAGKTLKSLALNFRIRGVGAMNGFVTLNGASFVTVPVLDPGLLEVSTVANFSPSKSFYVPLSEDGTWEQEIATPTTGERALYARIQQAGQTVASATSTFTVVP